MDMEEEVTVPTRLLIQAYLVLGKMPDTLQKAIGMIWQWVPEDVMDSDLLSSGREQELQGTLEVLADTASLMDLAIRTSSELDEYWGELTEEGQDQLMAIGQELIREAVSRGTNATNKMLWETVLAEADEEE